MQQRLDARGLAAVLERLLVALFGDLTVFERGKALLAPQVRIIEILRDLAQPDAHAAFPAKAAEGVHRAEKRLARQLLGDALAPGQRKQIPVHVVEVHGVHLFKIRQRPHPLSVYRTAEDRFSYKKIRPSGRIFSVTP